MRKARRAGCHFLIILGLWGGDRWIPKFAGQLIWPSLRALDLSEKPCLKETRQTAPKEQQPGLPSVHHTHAHNVHTCTHIQAWGKKKKVKEHPVNIMCSFFITTYDETEIWMLLSQSYINKYLLSSLFGPEILLVIGNTTVRKIDINACLWSKKKRHNKAIKNILGHY